MSDLIILYTKSCLANTHWSTIVPGSSSPHVVTYHEGKWDCDCLGWRYRQKCKHVEAAKGKRCTWGSDAFCGSQPEPTADDRCPKCGGQIQVLKVAV